MRISDWSSDVCSSDLEARAPPWPLPFDLRSVGSVAPTYGFPGRSRSRGGALSRGSADGCAPTSPRPSRPTATQPRSEEHTSELQSLMRISYAVFCLNKKKTIANKSLDKDTTKPKQLNDQNETQKN